MNKQLVKAHDLEFEMFLEQTEIQARVQALGRTLKEKYGEKNPIFLGILKGAFIFISDLVRAFDADCEIAFLQLSSYRGMNSTGDLQTVLGLNMDISGRHIILVEDIVDTGNTMSQLIPDLKKLSPASLALTTLLFKPSALQHPDLQIDHIGFEIPNHFVIGYGLDYNQCGRQWAAIYKLVSE